MSHPYYPDEASEFLHAHYNVNSAGEEDSTVASSHATGTFTASTHHTGMFAAAPIAPQSNNNNNNTACPMCGVDMHTAYNQVDKARRKLQLLQERLKVDQELLKQDKRNFKRRLAAAKAAARSQAAEQANQAVRWEREKADIDKEISSLKRELEYAKAQQQLVALQPPTPPTPSISETTMTQVIQAEVEKREVAEEQSRKLAQQIKELQDQILHLQLENDKQVKLNQVQQQQQQLQSTLIPPALEAPSVADSTEEKLIQEWSEKLKTKGDEIAKLQRELEDKCIAVESYEMQLLELERERDAAVGGIGNRTTDDATCNECISCQQLERQLQETNDGLDQVKLQLETSQRALDRERDAKQILIAEREGLETARAELEQLHGQTKAELAALKEQVLSYRETIAAQATELEHLQQVDVSRKQQQAMLLSSTEEATRPSPPPVIVGSSQDLLDHPGKEAGTHYLAVECEWTDDRDPDNIVSGIYTGWMTTAEPKRPDGSGTLRFEDGAIYDGEWSCGEKHGYGVFTTIDGDVYSGQWSHNQHHGQGVFVWSDGRVYRGQYQAGARQGQGIMTWPYGAHYIGSYASDKRNGHGVYRYHDGRCYTGMYRDERPEGYGTLTAADGSILYQGHWELGEFIGEEGPASAAGSQG